MEPPNIGNEQFLFHKGIYLQPHFTQDFIRGSTVYMYVPHHLFPCTVVCLTELSTPKESGEMFGEREPRIWASVRSLTGPILTSERRSTT